MRKFGLLPFFFNRQLIFFITCLQSSFKWHNYLFYGSFFKHKLSLQTRCLWRSINYIKEFVYIYKTYLNLYTFERLAFFSITLHSFTPYILFLPFNNTISTSLHATHQLILLYPTVLNMTTSILLTKASHCKTHKNVAKIYNYVIKLYQKSLLELHVMFMM